jgi:hypothetical protein
MMGISQQEWSTGRNFVIALAVLVFGVALVLGFFVGRSCSSSSALQPYRIDQKAARQLEQIESQRKAQHRAIDDSAAAAQQKILDDAKKQRSEALREQLLKGAQP